MSRSVLFLISVSLPQLFLVSSDNVSLRSSVHMRDSDGLRDENIKEKTSSQLALWYCFLLYSSVSRYHFLLFALLLPFEGVYLRDARLVLTLNKDTLSLRRKSTRAPATVVVAFGC